MSASISLVSATSILYLNSQPNSDLCNRYSIFTLSGSMDYYNYINHQYPSDGLIGLEIQGTTGAPMVVRTIRTGGSMPNTITAYIDSAYLCDSSGNQQTSISLPTQSNGVNPYYYMHVNNNDGTAHQMLLVMNVYDSNGVPISLAYQTVSVGAYSSSYVRTNFLIPSTAHYGVATAYVSAYSNWPSQGGVPYGIEQTFQFTITGGVPFVGTPSIIQSSSGYYNFSYRIPKTTALGTYTAYTSANYLGISGSSSASFQIVQLGDLNSDGTVNFRDLTTFVSLYVTYYTNHAFNSAIDYTSDGKINFNDLTRFVQYYIFAWSS